MMGSVREFKDCADVDCEHCEANHISDSNPFCSEIITVNILDLSLQKHLLY